MFYSFKGLIWGSCSLNTVSCNILEKWGPNGCLRSIQKGMWYSIKRNDSFKKKNGRERISSKTSGEGVCGGEGEHVGGERICGPMYATAFMRRSENSPRVSLSAYHLA